MRPDPYDITEDESWWRQLDNDNQAQAYYQEMLKEQNDADSKRSIPEISRSPESE